MKPEKSGIAFTLALVLILAVHCPGQEIYDSQNEAIPRMLADDVAVAARLPEGFRMHVAASEPLVQQPIAMAWDLNGRLWVAENHTYAEAAKGFDLGLSDRIVILEDTDQDAVLDKRTVFCDKLKQLTSIELVDGGVIALAPPNLLFIADSNRNDIPDREPTVLVSGFNANIRHNLANGLRFGPDGWLYGRHGILGSSDVTVLNTSVNELGISPPNASPPGLGSGMQQALGTTRLTCGIWRYHPRRYAIEMVCEGTTNPWGMDWDSHGNLFFINTVIGHLWHAIPGSHLQRMYGEDSDPDAYQLLPQIADHVHWDETGEDWRETRKGPPSSGTDRAGGGHAHCGMMIYQADQWPSEYQNQLFTLNLHGRRINRDRLERIGAGFVGRHAPDMVFWNDPWFRGIELSTAPDGSVYVLDWSDIGECHEDDGVHRTSGRIYRIVHQGLETSDKLRAVLLDAFRTERRNRRNSAVMTEATCLKILRHPNVWYARELWKGLAYRRIGVEESKGLISLALRPAKTIEDTSESEVDSVTLQLRALWTLYAADRLPEEMLFRLMQTPQHESVHAWAIRLMSERMQPLELAKQTEAEEEVVDMLSAKPIVKISPLVRLYTASLLPKFTHQKWRLASMLSKSKDLANDRDFPLVFWYGTKDFVSENPMRAAKIAIDGAIPKVAELYLRRLASGVADGEEAFGLLLANLASRNDPEWHAAAVRGLWGAYQGRVQAMEPSAWPKLAERVASHPDSDIREKSVLLQAIFRGNIGASELIALVHNKQSSESARRLAIRSLGRIEDALARDALWKMVPDPSLGKTAAESLGPSMSIEEANRLVNLYAMVSSSSQMGIVSALGSRRDTLPILLDAIESQKIPKTNIDAATWRQFASVADWELLNRARAMNPAIGVTQDQNKIIQEWEQIYTIERLSRADASRGRSRWNTACASCHKLFGEGGAIGPELTGAQRSNLRYWLENILAPSAVVAENYRVTAFLTDDGRVITGVPVSETNDAISVQTTIEKIVLSKKDIEQRKPSDLSLMPHGILDPLQEDDRADLFKYLMSPNQVPAQSSGTP
jgi:putative membrane-bound dehydrogenase-like protein